MALWLGIAVPILVIALVVGLPWIAIRTAAKECDFEVGSPGWRAMWNGGWRAAMLMVQVKMLDEDRRRPPSDLTEHMRGVAARIDADRRRRKAPKP